MFLKLSSNTKLAAIVLVSLAAAPAYSGQVTYTNDSYTSGDTLTASDLNGKFNEVKVNVNDNNQRITTLEGAQPCLSDGTNCKQPGTLFTNWGRNDCPVGSAVAYTGYIAGKNYTHTGGGTNLLCLTDSPTDPISFSDANQDGALLYGAEFETNASGIASLAALHDLDPLCSVCVVDNASMQLMLPGSTACPTGWSKQYDGYLMSTQYNQNASESICVNANPVTRVGSEINTNGTLLYTMEAECGALPCGPYTQNREISCSVCTR